MFSANGTGASNFPRNLLVLSKTNPDVETKTHRALASGFVGYNGYNNTQGLFDKRRQLSSTRAVRTRSQFDRLFVLCPPFKEIIHRLSAQEPTEKVGLDHLQSIHFLDQFFQDEEDNTTGATAFGWHKDVEEAKGTVIL